MRKAKVLELPTLIRDYFDPYLVQERHLSPCTVASYCDALKLMLNYVHARTHKSPCQQQLQDWDAVQVLGFLNHVEKERGCCASSRNARLAALHSFMAYVSRRSPQALDLASRVLAIPNKRHTQAQVGYLTQDEAKALLQAPDVSTFSGQRDHLLFQMLYNTGARVSELVNLDRQHVEPHTCKTVTLMGKGRKQRTVPLWPKTARLLRDWLLHLPSATTTPIFSNRFGTRLTRFGVQKRLAVLVVEAATRCPSLRGRSISPHLWRHTTAMHLLQADVDVTQIALWLGHESLNTTHKYIEANLEMKQATLNKLKAPKIQGTPFRPKDKLLRFLESL